MSVYHWSQTAATNASSDPNINFSEGQAPSSLNDSDRAKMAALKKWVDDIAGGITTSGTSTAYTVTSYSVYDSLAHLGNMVVAFVPHATNGATVTLNVDGLGAKPLRSAPSTELVAGTLIQGTPYTCIYNASDQAFYLHNFFVNPYVIPIGAVIDYTGSTAPNSSFALCYGQALNRSTYSVLFGINGTSFGSGDGSTTFNILDARGRVIAGKDDMGGSAASRLTSTYFGTSAATLGAVGGLESHTLTTAQLASHSHANSLTDPGHHHTQNEPVLGGGATWNNQNGAGNTAATLPGPDTANSVTGISITNANSGSGNAHNNVQPTIICNKLLRVI